ncbi:hypothetical protein [Xylophilus sp.]|uniref:hypothetical protein n=1 Tax=Xylophilus sp. TaxID=2653893 RepID=UPI002D7E5B88|nr:hypothetical protein [Xylophilus sp.]
MVVESAESAAAAVQAAWAKAAASTCQAGLSAGKERISVDNFVDSARASPLRLSSSQAPGVQVFHVVQTNGE